MPIVDVPVNTRSFYNLDEISNEKENMHVNVILVPKNDKFVSKRRPGYQDFATLGTGRPVNGNYWWEKRNINIFNSGGSTFKAIDGDGTIIDITGVSINQNNRVIFAESKEHILMASGGQIAYTDGTTTTQFISDPDAPVNCTHVDFIDQFIIANDTNEDKFYFSQVGDPFNWSALSFISAESNFDRSEALKTLDRNIVIFGEQSIEFWFNAGGELTPFRRRNDVFIDIGTKSPYSIAETEKGILFISQNREVFLLNSSGQTQKVSRTFDRVLQSLTNVRDALGDNYIIGGKGFYVLHFPTDKKTYFYDYENDYWGEWAHYNSTLGSFDRYKGQNYSFSTGFNEHLIGDFDTDKIYKLSFDSYDDAGDQIRWLLKTGNINYEDIINDKLNMKYSLLLKTGFDLTNQKTPELMLRYRDNNGVYDQLQSLDLKKIGNTDFILELFSQGIYRTREIEFSSTDPIDIEFVRMQEEYEVLNRS
jgi:hypothetical protein